ncbi:MAG TPA: hypothetical protein VF174_10925 [Micromonosporaceae bacterium]
METTQVRLHGGPLDGSVRTAPVGPDGRPAERAEFDHEPTGDGLWYVEYQRERLDDDGWHYQATGIQQRADEE